MGFKRTSEGRVFFETPNETQDNVGGKDLQIVGLLKALNTRLKDGQLERAKLMGELNENRRIIKALEARTNQSEQAYINLEQRMATRQNENAKKSARAEAVSKDTLKELLETKETLGALKEKTQLSDKSFSALKAQINKRKQTEDVLRRHQIALEKVHREQSEKMVGNVAAYVALTKRVNDAEAKFDTLDNKVADTVLKQEGLNKKIEKSAEDRNRMIRKVDRIEEAVLETRDALNAKALVVLADQDNAASNTSTDPLMLESQASRLTKKGALLNKSGVVTFLFGALLTSLLIIGLTKPIQFEIPFFNKLSFKNSNTELSADWRSAPITERETNIYSAPPKYTEFSNTVAPVQNIVPEEIGTIQEVPEDFKASYIPPALEGNVNDIAVLDITNEQEMLSVLEGDPMRVATALNNIEPGDVVPELTQEVTSPVKVASAVIAAPAPMIEKVVLEPQAGLENRIKPDTKLPEAIVEIEKQAFSLIPEAQHDLAAIYTAGHGGVKQDFSRAALWFKEAAEGGVANASYNLGVLYQQGLGVRKDLEEAIYWYQAASGLNHPEAQYNLGIAYIEGIGVPYDSAKAAVYFKGAASQGIMEAAYNLGLIYENGLLGNAKPDEALVWYKTAADQGSPEAKEALKQLAKTLNIKVKDINDIVETITGSNASFAKPAIVKEVRPAAKKVAPKAKEPTPQISAQPLNDVDVIGARETSNKYTDQRAIVASIQANLIEMGLYPGPADGINGPLTADAIRAYQLFHDFEVDGKISEKLLEYMEEEAR